MNDNEEGSVIPQDLNEAVAFLRGIMDEGDLTELKQRKLEEMCQFHFSSGMSLRNHWNLWHGGPLREWFRERGVWHADDMSAIILDALWHEVHGAPFVFEGQVAEYTAYWKAQGVGFDGIPLPPNQA